MAFASSKILRSRKCPPLLAMMLATVLTAAPVAGAFAQPARPVHVVVPYAPGGAVDTVTRLVTQKMADDTKQFFIVENRPGASTNIGMEAVARSTPDGAMLLTASNTLASNKALFSNLRFDPEKDFMPVGAIGYAPLVVVVPASSPYKTLAALIADAKANPAKLSYGSAGNGSSGHLAAELLKSDAHFDALHVPYKGGAPAITDLIGGRISFMCINPVEVIGHIQSGRLRALAVMDQKSASMLPGVPTTSSMHLNGSIASVWWGLVGPKGMPADRVAALNTSLRKVLADPATVQSLGKLGATVTPDTPDAFGTFIKQETVKWTRVIETAKIRAD